MKRLPSLLAAAAAAAAVTAAISLPAAADSRARSSQVDELASFTACLRGHDVAVPDGLGPRALKEWLATQEGREAFEAAMSACNEGDGRFTHPPEELVTCLRAHGLTPPTSLEALKPWIGRQSETVLNACGLDAHADKPAGGCAGDPPRAVSPSDRTADAAARR